MVPFKVKLVMITSFIPLIFIGLVLQPSISQNQNLNINDSSNKHLIIQFKSVAIILLKKRPHIDIKSIDLLRRKMPYKLS